MLIVTYDIDNVKENFKNTIFYTNILYKYFFIIININD